MRLENRRTEAGSDSEALAVGRLVMSERNAAIMRGRLAVYTLAAAVAFGVVLVYVLTFQPGGLAIPDALRVFGNTETVEVTDYKPPAPTQGEELVDDQLSEKTPPFLPELIDRRPEGAWRINTSAAVVRLDVPMLKPDTDASFFVLRPSYADAIANAPSGMKVLPSINVIDGKAKQFDDGLVAAIELAHYKGLKPRLQSHVTLIERLQEQVGPASEASAYLAAGLEVAGIKTKTSQQIGASTWFKHFESDPTYSKPVGFYTWSDELSRAFRFMRYFQQPLPARHRGLIDILARAVGSDSMLLADYKKMIAFHDKLTSARQNRTLDDVFERDAALDGGRSVAVFPTSRSRETVLFERLFPGGLPPTANLMRELIHAIRSGGVDLAPRSNSGWYEYQVYALEAFLLPWKGPEHEKLLLTKAYKKRMIDAFAAVMTKRRETHVRLLEAAKSAEALPPPVQVRPRLRIEPCPSYYLRMARSYDFLLSFLLATVGNDGLSALHGLKEGGERSKSLLEELRWFREFFYGLHLLCAEDIGMVPGLRPDEPVDKAACEAKATEWLASYATDADLKADTRVSVPLYFDFLRQRTRLWATVGVRLAKLDVSFARPPKIKPSSGSGDWKDVTRDQLEAVEYVMAVDEFAEAEIPGTQPLNRKEFRDVCDRCRTNAEIVDALFRRSP